MNEKTQDQLKEAIRLRTEGAKEASRAILLELVSAHPEIPEVLYHCAWTHDSLGLEKDAVAYYERAIAQGLQGEDLAGAYLGLGSTLRGLGQYSRALEILDQGVRQFPEKRALRTFRSMALYNTGQSKEAVATLLKLLAETSADPEITAYKRAILFYSEDLDCKWSS